MSALFDPCLPTRIIHIRPGVTLRTNKMKSNAFTRQEITCMLLVRRFVRHLSEFIFRGLSDGRLDERSLTLRYASQELTSNRAVISAVVLTTAEKEVIWSMTGEVLVAPPRREILSLRLSWLSLRETPVQLYYIGYGGTIRSCTSTMRGNLKSMRGTFMRSLITWP